jgi:hypothetical protein
VAGTALVDDISVDEEFIQGAYWFLTTYRILYKPRITVTLPIESTEQPLGGWDLEYILNAGPMAFYQDPITDEWSKKAVTHGGYYDGRPACLNDNGTEIPLDPDTGVMTEDPTFLTFHIRERVAFSGLNLVPPIGWVGV